MPQSDDQLIRRFKKGDSAAFESLFERYANRIHGFGFRMCRHREDAQDILQETFLSAFRNLKNFRGGAKLTTWLYKIASSACLKKRRLKAGEPSHPVSLELGLPGKDHKGEPVQIPDWSNLPLKGVQEKEMNRALDRAVAELPKEYRLVLVLRDMEGVPASEVGRILGLSVPAVKSRLHRARLHVRSRLQKYYEKN